ncbi:hypothetical protein Ahy_B06g081923 [Arachis hypogaea]|uniref:Uncharacterized protein n=1 Tax=Arachis hypogaea TaxID=3818 RepID=A0A444YMK9_ARAHY|nr:hypothetical protein Ahy_B06g081923 [Arachis hypogaea]
MCLAPLVIPSATNLVVSGNQLRVAATATCHLRRSIEDASTPPSVALPSFTPWWKCPCIADALASAATVRPEQPLTAMLPSSLPRRLPQGVPPPLPSPRSQEKLLRMGHIFDQTLENYKFLPPIIAEDKLV